MSTRIQEVGQGVTGKGAKFRIWRQTDLQVICTIVSLQKSTEYNLGLKELMMVRN